MTPDLWRSVEQLYHEAIELPTGEREDFLIRASAGDEVLRTQVARLLKSNDEAGGFLDKHALEVAARSMAQSARLATGQQISHYMILSLCGAGGMGEVYLADDTRLDRRVALKILPLDLPLDEKRMGRFVREAKAASALNHPNVATIYDIGESSGVAFIAMEYVEGQTLAQKIHSGPLEPSLVIEIGRQAADALDAAHAKGIIHRDVKPANLILTPRGQVKVLDFGLAKMADPQEQKTSGDGMPPSGTLPGVVMGTAPYMSPEQLLGKEVDHRSDIFSLGVVLYEMVTGRSPFPGSNTTEIMGRILHTEPDTMRALSPQAASDLERIVHKCLKKDREHRYCSARELHDDLTRLQRDGSSAQSVTDDLKIDSDLKDRRAALQDLSLPTTLFVAFLGASVALALGLWWQPWKKSVGDSSEQHLISTFPGAHRQASFSPDGNSIAFINDVDGIPQLWVKDLNGGEPRQITSGKMGVSRPRWSPKTDQILYTLHPDSNMPEGLFPTGDLWLVSSAGGVPRKLIGDAVNPSWSGDGATFAFERGVDLWIADADGSDQRRIENVPNIGLALADRRPAFSPNGALIAFFQNDEGGPWGDIWVIPSMGGVARRLTRDLSFGGGLTWTPDGRFIVFASARKGSMTLWKVGVAGGSPEPVLSSAGEDTDPEISRDGRKLIYTNTHSTNTLVLTDPATGMTTALHSSGTAKGGGAFSPRGDAIAFSEATENGIQLFTIGSDGKNLTQITRGPETQSWIPQWSADGSWLYYFQTPKTSFRKIPAQGGESVEIASGWTWHTHNGARVDPEDKKIIYSKVDRGIAVQTLIWDIQTGTEAPFTLALRHPRWSADGRFVVGRDALGNITTCPTDGASCRSLTTGWTPNWSIGDSRIYFDRDGTQRTASEVWSISRDGADVRKMADLLGFSDGNFIDYSLTGQIAWIQSKSSTSQLWLTVAPSR